MNALAVEVKQRKRPEEYWFSTEIRVQCKYTVRDGKKVAIVSYRPLLHTIQKRLDILGNATGNLFFRCTIYPLVML